MVTENDLEYIGQWKNDYPHGKGILSISNGTYTGNFKYGLQSGYGEFDGPKKSYKGFFFDGKRWGEGVCYWADVGNYFGRWKEDKQHGYGVFTWLTGEVYRGEWVAGEFGGRGRYVYGNGSWEEGDFVDGVLEGEGGFWDENGVLVNYGIWRDNEFVSGLAATKKKIPLDYNESLLTQSTLRGAHSQHTVITKIGPECDYL